jgi:hypothetical protein
LLLGITLLINLATAPVAAAGELRVRGLLYSGEFHPPDATGSRVTDHGPVPWTGSTLWVDRRGTYRIESRTRFEDYPARTLLYRGTLDLDRPLERLVAVSDFGDEEGTGFELVLEAGIIYHLVTTFAEPVTR